MRVQLVAVRVLDCTGSGTNAQVVSGINWVTSHAIKPAVANMSLGGGVDTTLDNAVTNSIASGITYGVAAGNGNASYIGIAELGQKAALAAASAGTTAVERTAENTARQVELQQELNGNLRQFLANAGGMPGTGAPGAALGLLARAF